MANGQMLVKAMGAANDAVKIRGMRIRSFLVSLDELVALSVYLSINPYAGKVDGVHLKMVAGSDRWGVV